MTDQDKGGGKRFPIQEGRSQPREKMIGISFPLVPLISQDRAGALTRNGNARTRRRGETVDSRAKSWEINGAITVMRSFAMAEGRAICASISKFHCPMSVSPSRLPPVGAPNPPAPAREIAPSWRDGRPDRLKVS